MCRVITLLICKREQARLGDLVVNCECELAEASFSRPTGILRMPSAKAAYVH